MNMTDTLKKIDELTQKELFTHIKNGDIKQEDVVLVGMTLKEIDTAMFEQMRYNPFELKKMPTDKLFVFFCDTGKETLENLHFYREKLPDHTCVSLKGGRGYWRPNLSVEAV